MKRKVKRPFDNEQFRKGYVAGIFAAEKELNTELLHFAEKAHKIMSEGTFPDYGVKINFKDSNNTITTNLDMKTEEKAKKYDEALEWMREVYPTLTGAAKEDAEHYFPELKESEESEDERIRKAIVELIKRTPSSMFDADTVGKWIGASHDEILAYLEKQKEQPKEELVYRMNGLMQEYIKEGEDDAEKEHRLKCYQLFWDALEDADFFEQKKQKPSINIDQLKSLMLQYLQEAANEKEDSDIEADTDKWARKILGYNFEQKPVDDKAFEEWIDVWYNEHHRDGYITMDEREFKNFCRGIRNMYQQKPAEWDEEDEKLRKNIIWLLEIHPSYRNEVDWLKSLRPQSHWKPSEEQMEALSETIAFAPDTFKPKCTLVTLQYDLKKLMEE